MQCGSGANMLRLALAVLGVLCVFTCRALFAAERFDDISVQPEVFFEGETFHGYVEHRVIVENHSPDKTRRITLELPNDSHAYGTSLRRISRTAAIGPSSTVAVSLWQPPLPIYGDDRITVYVDGRRRGDVHLGASTRHRMGYMGPGGTHQGTFLVSRSLNSDDLDKLLKGEALSSVSSAAANGPFSPAMTVGPPRRNSTIGLSAESWCPDESRGVAAEWLEVDFTPSRVTTMLRVYTYKSTPSHLSAIVLFDSGHNEIARYGSTNYPPAIVPQIHVNFPSIHVGSNGGHTCWEVGPLTVTNAISTVRLEFTQGRNVSDLSIAAVELYDGKTAAFASAARASSSRNSGPRYRGGRSPAEVSPMLAHAELEASAWSDHWLSYTPFDAVLINRADYNTMPPATQSAVWNWVQAGGNLVVLGDLSPPAPWDKARQKDKAPPEMKVFTVGFGSLVTLARTQAKELVQQEVRFLRDLGRTAAGPWNVVDETTANSAFSVVENLRIPVRGLVALMLIFILVVGPANIFVLSRMNRRIWLLWTIPVISAFTCVLVFAWTLFSEGVTPQTRVEGVTLLDQTAHRATTLGMAAFYAPLTPSDGLRYSYDTEVTMMGTGAGLHSYGRSASAGTPVELELSQVQHLRRGWVSARVPAHFQLRKSEARRERVQIERSGKNLLAVNGLGANIESLWLADERGNIFTATNIIAGQKITLASAPEGSRAESKPDTLQELFRSAMWDATRSPFWTDPVPYLRPGSYVAVLKEQPFLENALGKRTKARTRAIVYGVLGPEDVK